MHKSTPLSAFSRFPIKLYREVKMSLRQQYTLANFLKILTTLITSFNVRNVIQVVGINNSFNNDAMNICVFVFACKV